MEFPDDGCSSELKCTDHHAVVWEWIKHSAKTDSRCFPRIGQLSGLKPRPRSRPQRPRPGGSEGTPARLRAQSRAKGPQRCAQLPWKPLRAHAQTWGGEEGLSQELCGWRMVLPSHSTITPRRVGVRAAHLPRAERPF